MKYINKFNLTTEFEAAKEELQGLEHYLVYDVEKDKVYLKMPTDKSYVLNYKITQNLIDMSQTMGGKLPLITRCDLFKSIKVDGIEQDLSSKVRTPYEFKGETSEELQQELQKIIFDESGLNETYVLTTSDLVADKEGTIKVVWQDEIPLKSLIGCILYNMCLTTIPNDMFINKEFINTCIMFGSCNSLATLDLSKIDTTNVTNMSVMFGYCNSLATLDLSSFNTSRVTDMSFMFQGCTSLTSLDLSNFDTSNVTNMNHMFDDCTSLTSLDVSSFDTANVSNMENMFSGCESLTSLNLNNFNTSNVTNMTSIFKDCTNLASLDLSSFNTSNVKNMYGMFNNCSGLTSLDLSNFDTTNVTNMNGMFTSCKNLTNIKCKQAFKDWCWTNQDKIVLPTAMRYGGEGTWDIID